MGEPVSPKNPASTGSSSSLSLRIVASSSDPATMLSVKNGGRRFTS